jgi:type II restriction/modification system DNA methylase subunit YeeA
MRVSIEPLPFPNFAAADKSRHDKLVLLVDKLLGLMPKLRAATLDAEKAVLQNAVTATDQQIDALVYELYGLTEDEIKLVEGGQ